MHQGYRLHVHPLLNSSPDPCTRAWLRAVATKIPGPGSVLRQSLLWTRPSHDMEDDVPCVTLGLCLGIQLCKPHQCRHCRTAVGHLTNGLSCHFSRGCHSRHADINDIINRPLGAVKIPCHLEPTGHRLDGKHPD